MVAIKRGVKSMGLMEGSLYLGKGGNSDYFSSRPNSSHHQNCVARLSINSSSNPCLLNSSLYLGSFFAPLY